MQIDISSKFRENVQKSIYILLNANYQLSDDMVLDLLQSNGINKVDSTEILLFLPIAFLRRLYVHLKWHESFCETKDDNNYTERKYSDYKPYQIIWQETQNYFDNIPVSKDILKIAGRSAEFNALNSLLLQNPELKAEDIVLSQTFIVR